VRDEQLFDLDAAFAVQVMRIALTTYVPDVVVRLDDDSEIRGAQLNSVVSWEGLSFQSSTAFSDAYSIPSGGLMAKSTVALHAPLFS
jgi:hypothetical protein